MLPTSLQASTTRAPAHVLCMQASTTTALPMRAPGRRRLRAALASSWPVRFAKRSAFFWFCWGGCFGGAPDGAALLTANTAYIHHSLEPTLLTFITPYSQHCLHSSLLRANTALRTLLTGLGVRVWDPRWRVRVHRSAPPLGGGEEVLAKQHYSDLCRWWSRALYPCIHVRVRSK